MTTLLDQIKTCALVDIEDDFNSTAFDSCLRKVQLLIGQNDGGPASLFFADDSRVDDWKNGSIEDRIHLLADYVRYELSFPSAIAEEVKATFSDDEIREFESFGCFWREVDVQNGYEDGWEDNKSIYQPYYLDIYNSCQDG